MAKNIETYFSENRWEMVSSQEIPARPGQHFEYTGLDLSSSSLKILEPYTEGIYHHQKAAIQQVVAGSNVVLTTGTASGKTLVFQVAALETLTRNPKAKILAIYPMKALAMEQEERWQAALETSGLNLSVGRIDGSIKDQKSRMAILKRSSVLILTPDVMHAWLLGKIQSQEITKALKQIEMVIIDEAHNYSGVFGSNAAFLFRRLNCLVQLLRGNIPQYVAVSATIKNPLEHMKKLTGRDYTLIGCDQDSSPRSNLTILMVNPPQNSDLLAKVSDLANFIANRTFHRFIAFVDSRKQTEYISTIAGRNSSIEDEFDDSFDLTYSKILPYRAGYEENDRQEIQEKLRKGKLSGVISTSALELGLDIPGLSAGILVGIPNSATSFYQRIGRIGRKMPGTIIIINNRTAISESIFRNPSKLLTMPLTESALYLDNPYLQYIHTLCFAREEGEYDVVCRNLGQMRDDIGEASSGIGWPESFIDLCHKERMGTVHPYLQTMKMQGQESPHITFPLRSCEQNYQVIFRRGPEIFNLGNLTASQLQREAYPGAIYYYKTIPYRVVRVDRLKHEVEVHQLKKKYFTSPICLPSRISPNLMKEGNTQLVQIGQLALAECELQILEVVNGYKERRGPVEEAHAYPLDRESGCRFDQPMFSRFYFTSGVVISHPALEHPGTRSEKIASALYEGFLMTIPFERQDVDFGFGQHKVNHRFFSAGSHFLAIFDTTYGSLRLSSRFIDRDVLKQAMTNALEILEDGSNSHESIQEITIIKEMLAELDHESDRLSVEPENKLSLPENILQIIAPGSKATHITRGEDFQVASIFYNPTIGRYAYRGTYVDRRENDSSETRISIEIDRLVPIPGESQTAFFNKETGEVSSTLEEAIRVA